MSWPSVQLRRIAHFGYGDSLSDAIREEGNVPVYGSNGQVGIHSEANTLGPTLIIGRKGSFGKIQYCERPVFAIDTTFYVDQSLTRSNLRWLFYALQTMGLGTLSEDVGVPGLSREKAYEQVISLPPVHTQRAIADYLDRETARIDALIDAKRQMVELLEEKQGAERWVATRLGLQGVSSRPSGKPWLGAVAAHWRIAPLKRVGSVTSGVTFPPEYQGEQYQELAYIKVSDLSLPGNEQSVLKAMNTVSRDTAAALGAFVFPPGAIMFPKIGAALLANRRRLLGRAACADQNLMGLVPHKSQTMRYFAYQLEGIDVLRLAMPGPVPFINEDDVSEISVAIPPPEEQAEIAQRLEARAGYLGRLRVAVESSIAALSERRTALVAAAVTGELDIQEAA
jgi:type I restriction enzyme S subunit